MTPEDCVALVEIMNELIVEEINKAVEEDHLLGIDRELIAERMVDVAGLPFDDIIRYCDIGEYIMADREIRGADEEEIARWRYKREAAVAIIESMIEQATRMGIIDEGEIERDPLIDELEQMWRNS
jgi:hypothetical protein